MTKKLSAWNEKNEALFFRIVKNKKEARKEILNHGLLAHVSYVLYGTLAKKYSISDVYKKWGI